MRHRQTSFFMHSSVTVAGVYFILAVFAQAGNSQTTEAFGLVGASNFGNSDFIDSYGFDLSPTTVNVNGSTQFFGEDSNGDSQTMGYSGIAQASANFGRLQTYAQGSITNSYFSYNNPPIFDEFDSYDPNGSPSEVQVAAQAKFTDTLQFGGSLAPGYQARYQFRITGFLSDPGAFHLLDVNIAGNQEYWYSPNGHVGDLVEFWGTQSYFIDGNTPQAFSLRVLSSYFVDLEYGPEGVDYSGYADFYNTVTLARIDVLDQNGDLVPRSNWTVSSQSGTVYGIPEPGSLTLLGCFGTLLLTTRRRR